ncbi:MAG TPA: Gfo/Idh/MocA family oxidoreductase [Ktedonobacteraceae bacterium]|nr:Gfo/Idh/MocA family oxidoreductase [Ktedonobacteraceae bacterium]
MSSNAHTLRVAIIGYGLGGQVFHAPLISSTPGMQVAAIVTQNPERQQMARQAYPNAEILPSVEDIWREPARYDLVVVTAPNRVHVAYGIAALQAGLPVVIDKPVAATVADAERLIEASKQAGKLLSVFQNRRWDNGFLTLQQILNTNMLGPVARYESRFDRYRPTPRANAWREDASPEDAGGLLYDLGSHLIDQAVVLFGKPKSVYAELARRRPGVQVDDDTFVAVEFENGVSAHFHMTMLGRIAGSHLRVNGLLGSYVKQEIDPQEADLRKGLRPGDVGWGIEPTSHWGLLSTDVNGLHFDGPIETLPGSYERYYDLMRDAILHNGKPPVDAQETLVTLRIIEAAQESARKGTTIRL